MRWHVSLQKVSVHIYLRKKEVTHTDTHTCRQCTRLLANLLVHCATGRLCSIPLKVLWAVISKTIPWMAALIENNEGHIEHMVAVVSPFPPSSLFFSLSLSHFVSLSLPNSPRQKVQSNFARLWQRCVKKKGRCQSCPFFLLTS